MAIHKIIYHSKAKYAFRLFLFINFLSGFIQASPGGEDGLSKAWQQYLNFESDSCRFTLRKAENIKKTPETLYLRHLLIATDIFLSDDPAYFKKNKSIEAEYLSEIDNSQFSAASRAFLKTEVKIQWAILKMKYGEEFSAFWNLRQAFYWAEETNEKYPDYLPAYKSLGFLYILFGTVPDKYNWLLSIFRISGDVQQGRTLLLKVWNQASFYTLESGIIISLADTYLLNQPEEGRRKIQFINRSTPSLLTDYVHCLILMKNADSSSVEKIINAAARRYPQPFKLPQLYYIAGEVNLQKGEIDKAIEYYDKFLMHQKGKGLIKDAYFKTGICYLIRGDKNMASNYFESARISGSNENEADQYAENQLNSGHISNKDLYRLRYATDGGYYELARQIQEGIDWHMLQGEDLVEYYYRTARLMQNSGDLNVAITYYEKTIKTQESQNWYYAPNAALLLGLIYIAQNQPENAKMFLELVFTFKKNYPYQKSIRQKAKAALSTLE